MGLQRGAVGGFAPFQFRQITNSARQNLTDLVQNNDLVVFMKGDPLAPQCGFSRTVCVLLEMHGVDPATLVSKDVLQDEELRQDIKEFS